MGKEFRQLWDSLPHKPFLGLLLVAWIALFHYFGNAVFGYTNTPSLWIWLNTLYENAAQAGPEQGNTADDELGRWVPLLVLALAWTKRKEIIDSPKEPWAPALILVALGLALHSVGFIIQQTRLSAFGAIVGAYGLIGTAWGPRLMRTIFFPYFILLFAIPIASVLPTNKLRLIVASASTQLCDWILNIKVLRQGTIIYSQKGTFHFDVAPACSGIRSLSVIVLLATCYAFLNFRSFWRIAFVIACSVPLAILGNIIRLCVVILVGDVWGQERAMMIETKFGFATFLFALGSLFALGALLNENRKPRSQSQQAPEPISPPTAP